jgi:hypothetical protein
VNVSGGVFTPSSITNFTGADLQISGSGAISNTAGRITFNSANAQTMTDASSGALIMYQVTINKAANNVTLNDPAQIDNNLTLTNGLVTTTATNLLTMGSSGTVSDGSSSSYINGPFATTGTGNKSYPIGKGGFYRPVELISMTGSSPVIRFELFNSNPNGTPGAGINNISTIRYWGGSVSSGTFTSAQVKLGWGDDDGVDGALSDLRVVTSATSGGTYADAGNSGTTGNGTTGTITSNSVSAMQYFTLGSAIGDNSLPVSLVSFEAIPDYSNITLNWTTASEFNNQGFNLYRALKEQPDTWQKVNADLIPGKGNYSSETNYSYADRNIQAGETYRYKLESVSVNGFVNEEMIIESTAPVPAEFAVFDNYPNPFNPTTNIKFRLNEALKVRLAVYDIQGRLINTLVDQTEYKAGEYIVQWNGRDIQGNTVATGMYFFRLNAGKHERLGKMILAK